MQENEYEFQQREKELMVALDLEALQSEEERRCLCTDSGLNCNGTDISNSPKQRVVSEVAFEVA